MDCHLVALLGSPRREGNTAILLQEAIRGSEDAGCTVELIWVPGLQIKPCMEIFVCKQKPVCAIKDEMQAYYDTIRNADGLIVATPVMTMGVPGALKSFIDRFQVFYMAKYERKEPLVTPDQRKVRKMLLLSIAGMNIKNLFAGLLQTMHAFSEIIDCPILDTLLRDDIDTIRDITTRPELLKEAYAKGYALGEAIKRAQSEVALAVK
jgi:multimeric flavodoxin WrbA